ncbi:MAG: tyrosine-type recombinase/integrase [Deltaproteobacteria bacterium]|nr:tyrosine-type recombinase/integrase [Deltaproteobacteria bacterium]
MKMKTVDYIELFLQHEKAKERRSLSSMRVYLIKHFLAYLEEQEKHFIEDITPNLLQDFQLSLAFKRKSNNEFYTIATRHRIVSFLNVFCRWLVDEDYLVINPARKLENVKVPERLPRHVLTEKEMCQLLESIDTSTTLGFRDRVIMEIFYGTAMRKNELRNLKLSDVDLENGYIFIEQGKGRKDRVVPIGTGLKKLIKEYILCVRPKLNTYGDNPYLVITYKKKGPVCPSVIAQRFRIVSEKSLLNKKIYPHLFRHACATHMIRRGAPLRHVQELLGHRSVRSTQVYTHITINDLKKAHKKYHPREQMKLNTQS